MSSDEAQIRQLLDDWMRYTKEGRVDPILDLMTDDAVFLIPGRTPMRKDEFARIAQAQAEQDAPSLDGRSDIQEIKIIGDHAYVWAELSVVITLNDGSPAMTRTGHTLTIFKKMAGRWLLARDANLLT